MILTLTHLIFQTTVIIETSNFVAVENTDLETVHSWEFRIRWKNIRGQYEEIKENHSLLSLPREMSGRMRRQWSSVHQVRTFSGSRGAFPHWPQWSWGKCSGGSSGLCTSELPVDLNRSCAAPDDGPRSDSGSAWASRFECRRPLLWLREDL